MTYQMLWVVEMMDRKGRWLPTAGAYISRSMAQHELILDWRYNYPQDKFRIAKYVPAAVPPSVPHVLPQA